MERALLEGKDQLSVARAGALGRDADGAADVHWLRQEVLGVLQRVDGLGAVAAVDGDVPAAVERLAKQRHEGELALVDEAAVRGQRGGHDEGVEVAGVVEDVDDVSVLELVEFFLGLLSDENFDAAQPEETGRAEFVGA